MFTVEDRGRTKDRILEIGRADNRIVAAALVGSTAEGEDRWSDLDVTFGLAPDVPLQGVLSDWKEIVGRELDAVHLFDLSSHSTVYMVFMLPGCLQVDLSFTPGSEFGPLGPRFKLLFGRALDRKWDPAPSPQYLFGYAVHHLVRARICIERKRPWQAEHWISASRGYALTMACLQRGFSTSHGRGFDQLPEDVVRPFADTLVRSLDAYELLRALGRTVDELLRNARDVGEPASKLEAQLRALASKEIV